MSKLASQIRTVRDAHHRVSISLLYLTTLTVTSSNLLFMRGRRVSNDLAWTIVRMALTMNEEEISELTRLSADHVKRVLRYWRRTGVPFAPPKDRRLRGRKRKLDYDHLQVSTCVWCLLNSLNIAQYLRECIRRRSDIYLDELKRGLSNVCGVHVSTSTIWRSLRRCGFTLKKV